MRYKNDGVVLDFFFLHIVAVRKKVVSSVTAENINKAKFARLFHKTIWNSLQLESACLLFMYLSFDVQEEKNRLIIYIYMFRAYEKD